jgi:putative ABC transport system permease protein
MTAGVSLPGKKYDDNKKIIRFYNEMVKRLESLPGVEGVAVANDLPLQGDDTTSYATIEDQQTGKADDHFLIGRHVINTGYFKALGIQFMSGREFTATDVDGTPSVIIINETAARRLWPEEDAIGKRIRFDNKGPWLQVVGVVADVKHNGLDAEPSIESYAPFAQDPYPYMTIALRAPNPTSYTAAIRREVQAIDKDQPVYDFETMEHILSESVAPRRLSMVLFALFAGVAMLLAGVGIYGVMSYSVTQRTHEIGVRMALGAKQKDVLRLIVGQGITLALVGVGIGLAAAFGLTRLMTTLLFGVSATDPVTFVAISLLLTGVALGACYVPARRATKVDPMVALRYE